MPHSYGYRARTRKLFARSFRKHGAAAMTTSLTTFRKGDYVDIRVDGSCHKGMPYKIYQGKTGKVFNINPSSIGVIVNKSVRNRIEPKRIHVRVEHIRKSLCKENFKKRVRQAEKEKRDGAPKKDRKRAPGKPVGEKMVALNSETEVSFRNPLFHKEIF
jgi:large subunit ribosomal protein L21e|tara:strand:- start:882 stop:1358 length:477 start_codon:yes stop_codon:yes gene_type:complete